MRVLYSCTCFFFHELFSLVNRLPSGGATPNSTGNEGVVYDEISRSAREKGNIGDTATTGPGSIELKENAAYQVGMNKH